MDEELAPTRWGSPAGLTKEECRHVIDLVHSAAPADVPVDHPLFDRAALNLCSSDEDEFVGALLVLECVSERVPTRHDVVQSILTANGAHIDSFLLRKDIPNDVVVTACAALFRCFAAIKSGLSGVQLLDLCSGSVELSFAVCASVVAGQPSDSLLGTVCRTLHQLTSFQTFWASCSHRSGTEGFVREIAEFDHFVAALNSSVAKHLGLLSGASALVSSCVARVVVDPQDARELRKLGELDRMLEDAIWFLTNCLSFSVEFSSQIRKEIVLRTSLVSAALLPYLDFLLQAHESNCALPLNILVSVSLVTRFLALLSFGVRNMRLSLSRYPMLGARLANAMNAKREHFDHVLRLVVNAELQDAVPAVLDVVSGFTAAERERLRRSVANPRDRSRPIRLFCETYGLLRNVFSSSINADASTPTVTVIDHRLKHRRARNRRRRAANRAKYRRLVDQPNVHADKAATEAPAVDDLGCECDAEDMDSACDEGEAEEVLELTAPAPPEDSRDGVVSWRSPTPAGVPRRYLCALTNKVMVHPVISPYGDTFEKDSILAYLRDNGNKCPITGEELFPRELVTDTSLKREVLAVHSTFL